MEKVMPDEQEAAIGSCFIVAASVTLLLLANSPHGGEKLEHILSGQILFTSWANLTAFLPVYLLVAGLWLGYPKLRTGQGFFLLFALVVTASVQLLGVYVVFASSDSPGIGRATSGWFVQSVARLRERILGGHRGNLGVNCGRSSGWPVPRTLLRSVRGDAPRRFLLDVSPNVAVRPLPNLIRVRLCRSSQP